MDNTSCAPERASKYLRVTGSNVEQTARPGRASHHEYLDAIHPTASCDLAPDGCHPDGWHHLVPSAPDRPAAAGRFPDDFGIGERPRRKPRNDGFIGRHATRATVCADLRRHSDDVDERARSIEHHRTIRSKPKHRRRRPGHTGGHQRSGRTAVEESAESADLPQGEPGGYACFYNCSELGKSLGHRNGRLRRHYPGSATLAALGRRTSPYSWGAEALRAS